MKHVKENDLAHGEFGKWLERVEMDKSQASRFIKIVEEHGNKIASMQIPMTILYEISTLPEPERTKEHTTSKGEVKKPDEMTVRELRELKKQLKQRDEQNAQLQSQVEQAQRSEEIARKQLEEVEDKEPEVIEKYMEPEDYQSIKNMNEHLQSEREYYKKQADDFRNEVKGMMDRSNNEVSFSKERGVVKHDVIDSLGRKQVKKFIDEGNLYRLITRSKLQRSATVARRPTKKRPRGRICV
ncbi:hypothetical protein [Staphylococcus debuckii]|uniref:hypothetical protein n=1 Tax=Staphylococcus debuckii TaxID=2044912 RepID=UPI003C72257B